MARSCPDCGSGNVVEDEFNSQTQWVCEDCGSVVSEGILTTTMTDEQNSRAVPYFASTKAAKTPCANLITGLGRVRSLCRILRLPSSMEYGAVSLFEQAYNHTYFLHGRLGKKEILGGCCVLFICRQNNVPITMGTIGSLLDTTVNNIGFVLKDLIKILNLQHTTPSIIDELEGHCHKYKLEPGQVPDVCEEKMERLVQRSSILLELASEVWIVTGRHPLPILTACVYVAWQSLKPKARMKYTLAKFCTLAKLPQHTPSGRRTAAGQRVNELRDNLCKLGRQLPWLRGAKVEPATVVIFVDDILQHRQTLMLQALKCFEDEQENEAAAESSPPAGEENWTKRHLFLPPSAHNSKRARRDPGPDVTGNEEISDSEIESYIRSPEEMKLFKEVHKTMFEPN